MFKFAVNNETYIARFKYSWELERTIKTYREFNTPDVTVLEKEKKIFVGTRCQIFDNDKKLIGEGFSLCSKKDDFSKPTGRKISFLRALVAAGFPKWDREAICNAVSVEDWGRNESKRR